MNFNLLRNAFFLLSFVLIFIFIVLGLTQPVNLDVDLGRHLLFGKTMVESGEVIKTNLLSFTNTDFKYINSHWLSEIVFYWLNLKLFSFISLTLLVLIVYLLTIIILFLFSLKRVVTGALLVTLPLFSYFLIIRADVRPEMFSYLFTALFIILLYKFREKYTSLIYLLILIMALWVNFHIYFAVGLVIIFLFLVENLILEKRKVNKKSKTLIIVLFLSIIASFINPNFIKGAIYPALFLNNYGIVVQENLNLYTLIRSNSIQIFIFHILIIASSIFFLIRYRKKAFMVDWLVVVLFGVAAILAIRNFYIFIIVAFYPFTKLFGFFIQDLEKFIGKHVNKSQLNILKALCYILILLTLLLPVTLQYTEKTKVNFEQQEQGKKVVDFFIENKMQGPIFNSFDIGQYLAYRLYPDELIYVDARPEAYPANFLKDSYAKSLVDYNTFKKEDKKYGFKTLFIHPTFYKEGSFINNVLNDKEYELIYLDSYALLFVKKSSLNKNLIEEHRINEESFALRGDEGNTELVKYVILFDEMNWAEAQQMVLRTLEQDELGLCYLDSTLSRRAKDAKVLKNVDKLPEANCP